MTLDEIKIDLLKGSTHYISGQNSVGIISGSLKYSTTLGKEFRFGAVCSDLFECDVYGIPVNVTGATVSVYVASNPTIPIICGEVVKSEKQDLYNVVHIEVYDAVNKYRDVDISAAFNSFWQNRTSSTIKTMTTSVLSTANIPFTFSTTVNADTTIYKLPAEPNSLTVGQLLQMVGELTGGITRASKSSLALTLVPINTTPIAVTNIQNSKSKIAETANLAVTGVSMYADETSFIQGVGTRENDYKICGNAILATLSPSEITAVLTALNNMTSMHLTLYNATIVPIVPSFSANLYAGALIQSSATGTKNHIIISADFSGVQFVEQNYQCNQDEKQPQATRPTAFSEGMRFSKIEQDISHISLQVGENADAISQINITVGQITSRVSDAEGNISTLTQTTDGISAEIESARGEKSSLKLNLDRIEGRVDDNQGNISTLTQTTSEISAEITSARGGKASLKLALEGISSSVSDVDGRVTTISQNLNGITLRVQGAEGAINTIEQTLEGVAFESNLAAGRTVINGGCIQTGEIQSENYDEGDDDHFSESGTLIGLEYGIIRTPGFAVDDDGSVFLKGEVIAKELTVVAGTFNEYLGMCGTSYETVGLDPYFYVLGSANGNMAEYKATGVYVNNIDGGGIEPLIYTSDVIGFYKILASDIYIADDLEHTLVQRLSGGGGGEPAAYIKNASVSGNTLTLTKKDNTTVTYTPSIPTQTTVNGWIKTYNQNTNSPGFYVRSSDNHFFLKKGSTAIDLSALFDNSGFLDNTNLLIASQTWVGNQGYTKLTIGTTATTAAAGNHTHSGYVPTTRTVNGHALSGNVTVTKSDVGLGNVGNFKAVSTVSNQGLTATEKSNARTNIGAGTSNLTIGTTATTAAAGNHTHSYSSLTDKPTIPPDYGNDISDIWETLGYFPDPSSIVTKSGGTMTGTWNIPVLKAQAPGYTGYWAVATMQWVEDNFVKKCLKAGTMIAMADGTEKPVEEVKPGDLVKSYDIEKGCVCDAVCLNVSQTGKADAYTAMVFDNNTYVELFGEHDIFIDDRGTLECFQFMDVGEKAIIKDGTKSTFLFRTTINHHVKSRHYAIVTSNNLYFANGILLGTRPDVTYEYASEITLPENIDTMLQAWASYGKASAETLIMPEHLAEISELIKKQYNARHNMEELGKLIAASDYSITKLAEAFFKVFPTINNTGELLKAIRGINANIESIEQREAKRAKIKEFEKEYADATEEIEAYKKSHGINNEVSKKEKLDHANKEGNENLAMFKEWAKTIQ